MDPNQILRHAGVTMPPVPVLRIARELGAQVRFSPGISYDGASLVRDGRVRILVREDMPLKRRREVLAREMGRVWSSRPLRFADELLMPRRWVDEYLAASGGDVEAMAHAFCVTVPRMWARLSVY